MREDAESQGPRITTSHKDERITPLGKFLRKSKLDELPQLWNVIKDDMAFIGPRPERPYFHERNLLTIKNWEDRLSVKPGISGLAQVMVNHDPEEKIIYDLQYIENKCWSLDFKIMILTAITLFGKDTISVKAEATFDSII